MDLAVHTWTDLADTPPDVVLVPVGSTEQHGPHAALGTDTALAEAVADRAATVSEHTVVVTPALPIGISEEHRAFAGTMWVSPDTFRAMIRETVASIASHGWTNIIVVNGHGGNSGALDEVCAQITRSDEAYCRPFTWFDEIDLPSDVPMGHAGAVETAALLATQPHLVKDDRRGAAAAESADRWGEWVSGVNLAVDSDEFSENGVVGDPTIADDTLGEGLLGDATEALTTLIDAVEDRT